jgi:hypothetical protein
MKDLGVLNHFLGITVEPRPSGLFLHQRQFTGDILERAGMTDCKSCSTPVDTQGKLSEAEGPMLGPEDSPTGVLLVRSSTSPSHGLTSPTPCSSYASTCMLRGSPTLLL